MALGILSFYGQMLLTRALQTEEAALVSVTRSASEVFFAFLFQVGTDGALWLCATFRLTRFSPSLALSKDPHFSKHAYDFINYRRCARYFCRHADLSSKVRHRSARRPPRKAHFLVHPEMILLFSYLVYLGTVLGQVDR